ncbi:immediate early response gene 5-like protein [Phyllopteryx taeniolatus]|uniref:immediate early response gene 5-like protein n=1 Tax=Phyllopteryx taeniolatus TaxID=161469 RepID=UPI002AD29E55|nr:immediate early response gene 5-like protein [Phyllopteryx taeniolatus]
MESALDAQHLISISLRKIQSSRTQRGGIKLHKNLLVTYVLRNARRVDMSENSPRTQRYEDVAAARETHQYLRLTGGGLTGLTDFYCNFGGADADTLRRGAPPQPQPQPQPGCQSAEAMLPPSDCAELAQVSEGFWTPAWEPPHAPSAHVNHKTVLDLDTHVVTTVTNGYFHSDCCAQPKHFQAAKKRAVVEPHLYLSDFGPVPCKRPKTDEEPLSDPEPSDSSNISNLISVLGSGGLSDFVSWQHADLEQIFASPTLSFKHTLLTASGWTRAIEAF